MAESEKIGKPLKLGALWWLTGGFKKTFKSRFSILTTHFELDWYKKQEDSKDGKRGGTLKKLNTCKIEEIEDQLGQSHCFMISNGNRNSQVLAADTERERLNWIVEILKFRGIEGLIEMIKDKEEKLSRHAAYAICNLAGRSRDDSQTRIVEVGGVAALLAYQKTCEEEDLVDSINYSFCKLSSREENKIAISQHIEHFYELLNTQNDRWIDFSLQTILNFSSNEIVQQRLFESGGLERLVDLLKQKTLKDSLLRLAVEGIFNCSAENRICESVKKDYLPILIQNFPSYSGIIQEPLIKLLSRCIKNENDLEGVSFIQNLIPLLVSEYQPLKLEAVTFLAYITKYDQCKEPVRNSNALSNLLTVVKEEDPHLILNGLISILNCWCDGQFCTILASFGSDLQAIVELLSTESLGILSTTLSILFHLTNSNASLEIIARFKDLTKTLVYKLMILQKRNINSAKINEYCFIILKNLSKFPSIMLCFCCPEVFSEIVSQICNQKENEVLSVNLKILANCNVLAITKKEIRASSLPLKLLEHLASDHTKVVIESLKVLSSSLLCVRTRELLIDCGSLPKFIKLLSSPNEKIQNLTIQCLSRFSYSSFFEQEIITLGVFEQLIKLLDSENEKTVELSIFVLRNCCGEAATKLLKQNAIPLIVKLLSSNCKSILENSLFCLANCFISNEQKDPCFAVFKENNGENQLLSLLYSNESDVQEAALWALCEYTTRAPQPLKFTESHVEKLIELLAGYNDRNSENAIDVLSSFCKSEKSILRNENFLTKLITLLSTLNLKVITSAAHLINLASQILENRIILSRAVLDIHRLVSSPHDSIRNSLSSALLNLMMNKENEIDVINPIGLEALLALWKSQSISVNQNHLKLKLNTNSVPYSIELVGSSPSLLSIEYQSPQVLVQNVANSSLYFHYGKEYSKKKGEEREKKGRKKKSNIISVEIKELSQNDDFLLSPGEENVRTSRSASFLPNSMRKFRPKTASGISAGSYRSRSGTNGKDDPNSNRLMPRQIDSFKYQLFSLSYYRCITDDILCEYSNSIRSIIKQYYVKEIDPIEFQEKESDAISFRDNPNATLKFMNNIVEYTSVRDFGIVGVAQSTKPLSSKGSYGYFEVFIISSGKNGNIGVGVACSNYPLDQQPGWKIGGWGYHGDDGNKYWCDDQNCCNDSFGPTFSSGDVIGCGMNNLTNQLFFTKNGLVVDNIAFSNLPSNLYPTIGLASTGEKVLVNQGQYPFLWDFDIENIQDSSPAPKAEPGIEREQRKNRREFGIYEIEYEKLIASKFDYLQCKTKRTKSKPALNNNI